LKQVLNVEFLLLSINFSSFFEFSGVILHNDEYEPLLIQSSPFNAFSRAGYSFNSSVVIFVTFSGYPITYITSSSVRFVIFNAFDFSAVIFITR
jgi:hypothetical protein